LLNALAGEKTMSIVASLQNLAAKPKAFLPVPRPVLLQRKCACGAPAPSLTGRCAQCQGSKPVQARLAMGESSDPLEREADRVADQVLAAPANLANPSASVATLRIQRLVGQAGAPAGTVPASVDRVLAGSGGPLDAALRQRMEPRFGHDFAHVRVHVGTAAEQSARDVMAAAFTAGHHIVFGAGQYAPATQQGQRLIAHELTHVVQQGGSAAAGRIQRQPQAGAHAENRALRDGVRREKWSEEIEYQYRRRGDARRADAMRACRLEGAPACAKILTAADLQVLYDKDIEPSQPGTPGMDQPAPSGADQRAGSPGPAGVMIGAAGGTAALLNVAPAPLAPLAPVAPVTPSIPWGTMPANTNLPAPSAPPASAGGIASVAGPAAAVVLPAVITGVHWYRWKTFQDKWIAAGYVLLEDPLRVCIGGCHLPSGPKTRPLPDDPEFSPTGPTSPFPFNPVPRKLPPGYTELKPFDPQPSAPTLGRVTPRQQPRTGPDVQPKPAPRPDEEDDRRKKLCEPHLHLPFGKTIHTELYGLEIASSRLMSAPTRIANRQRTSAYERSSKQIPNWNAGIGPRMDRKVLERGIQLGIPRERVLLPNWGPDGKFKQMDVDHIVELQVGWQREEELDRLGNYELLDASTNSSVGPTLDAAIQKERQRLKRTCKALVFDWDEVPLVFSLPMFPGGGKGPGQRWTTAEILKGRHLDVYPQPRRRR
jgi:hypothetical protein